MECGTLPKEAPKLIPANELDAAIEQAWQQTRSVPGFLTEAEARFLALAAACTPARGVIVEIGSFKGRSTVALASMAARFGAGPVVSIDPHTSPSDTDPALPPESSSFTEFLAALRTAGLTQQVEVHRAFSHEVGQHWQRPIRLLWIDGDHTYAGAIQDFELFFPHLAEGGIVALHDTLHPFDGPVRVFLERILRSDEFGPAGFWGSIAWAQKRAGQGDRFRAERLRLARRVARLIPFVTGERGLKGVRMLRYKLWRARVPHAPVAPSAWRARVSLGSA
jgi:MMP 1-O-methyltransferase